MAVQRSRGFGGGGYSTQPSSGGLGGATSVVGATGSGTSTGYTPPAAPTITTAPTMNSSVQNNPALQEQLAAINAAREKYISGSDYAITSAMSGVRDAGEGERRALTQSNAFRGAPGHTGQAAFSGNLQRQMANTGMQAAQLREANVQNMLGLGTQAAGAVAGNNLAQQQQALNQYNTQLGAWQYGNTSNYNAWQAQNQMALQQQQQALAAQQQQFNQQLALRQAQMSSPAYGV